MVPMATLTHRPTDCLGGRLRRETFRRHPSRGVGATCAAAASDNKQARPAQGRQRGRKPRHAAATVQPQKRAMENVVILKRGEQIEPKSETTVTSGVASPPVAAQAECAESVVAAGQLSAQALSETASATAQCGEPSEKVETAGAVDPCPAPTEKAEKASPTKIEDTVERCSVSLNKTEAVAAADLCTAPATATAKKAEPVVATAPVKKADAVAAANRIGRKARKAEAPTTVYSGASFVVSPDPCQLPIPIAFFKFRGGRTAACA